MRGKLGIDIDDCLLDTSSLIIKNLEKKVNRKIDINKITSFHIEENTGIDPDIVKRVVKETLESDYIPPVENAVKTINWLGTLYKPIYFISNKESYLYDNTINLINKVGINIDYELYLCDKINNIPNKASIILEKGIEMFIEDRVDTVEDIYNRTDCILLVPLKPWNKIWSHYVIFSKRIHMMENWIKIRNYFINNLMIK